MAHSLNYAETWSPNLIAVNMQKLLCSPFMTSNVKWLDAKTFHFTWMKTSGFRNHVRGGRFKEGKITQTDVPYTIAHDRDISFLVDKRDVDETNKTASMLNVSTDFETRNAIPETDALFFDHVSQAAITAGGKFAVELAPEGITKSNVVDKLIEYISPVKRYRGTLVGYVASHVMDKLEQAMGDKAKIEWTSISGMELSVETRVANFNGVYLFEVIDDERFYTKFDFKDDDDGGFEPNASGRAISVLLASTETVKVVKTIISIYYFEPGDHTEGDGYLYQHREAWDTFIFPNGKDGTIDSCVVVYANA